MPGGIGEAAVVERVYDGDTLKLRDGRHVRILGINTPEVDHGKEKTGQALGDEARLSAEAFFKKDANVRLFYDVQRVDRYERTLAHVYNPKGESLSAYLLRLGLGFHVAVPPNLGLNQCLQAQEQVARQKHLGVWRDPAWRALPARGLTMRDTGFKRVVGRVDKVRVAQSVWLELDGPLVIKISPADLANFSHKDWRSLTGKTLEVRGWVTERGGEEGSGKGKNEKGRPAAKRSYKSLLIQPRIESNLELL